MSSEEEVSFKASVELNDSKEREVRYFTISKFKTNTISINFLHLTLQGSFPILLKNKFVIYWIDHENDKIAISSDAELKFALSKMGDVKKLLIELPEKVLKIGVHKENCKTIGAEHLGVKCDVCHNFIFGFRYKCLICQNFDLCENCEGQKYHGKHMMIRLPIHLFGFNINVEGSQFGERLKQFRRDMNTIENCSCKLNNLKLA